MDRNVNHLPQCLQRESTRRFAENPATSRVPRASTEGAGSLRIAVPVLVLIIFIATTVFVFLFVFLGLVSKEDIGNCESVPRGAFWMYSGHVR
jgi:hypothetical protein